MWSTRLRLSGPMCCLLALGLSACGDEVVEFGATVPIRAIESAPLDLEMVFPPPPIAIIPFPEEVTRATGFNHLMINWEHHGHPPALFAVPHFDFHFYTVDPAEAAAMDCSDVSKPSQLPAGYALPDLTIPEIGELVGLCIPGMGMHSMLAAELDQTQPFGASMIVGYYRGDVIFVEPMIARAKLLAAESFTVAVPSVPSVGANVAWPSHFEAVYDESTQSYRFTYSGLGGG